MYLLLLGSGVQELHYWSYSDPCCHSMWCCYECRHLRVSCPRTKQSFILTMTVQVQLCAQPCAAHLVSCDGAAGLPGLLPRLPDLGAGDPRLLGPGDPHHGRPLHRALHLRAACLHHPHQVPAAGLPQPCVQSGLL